ncbi:MAG TPA: VanZ family protein [Burkholderiaceae bacterium]|nr:VanZ family protein [Burkholderiaceae bacterium]
MQALSVLFALGIVHASLYPWTDWQLRAPSALAFMLQAWPRYWTWFDLISNLLAYAVLALTLATGWFAGRRALPAWLAVVALCSLMSLALESAQSYLPMRVPEISDWIANTLGAALGGALGVAISHVRRRRGERTIPPYLRWLDQGPTAGWVLLLLWLLAQLQPQRLLLATGYLMPLLNPWSRDWLGVDLRALAAFAPEDGVLFEAASVICWMGALGILVMDLVGDPRKRVVLIGIGVALALAIRSVTGQMVLGSQAPLGFLTPGAQGGLVIGILVLYLLASLRRRTRAVCAIAMLVAALVLVNLAPLSAYHDSMLAAAPARKMANLHSLIAFVDHLWPLAAIGYFAVRVHRPWRSRIAAFVAERRLRHDDPTPS